MDPERKADFSNYGLRKDFRETLVEKSEIGYRDTAKAEKIRGRANNLDLRFQHLFEDIELLHRGQVLEALDLENLKVDFEETEPLIENRMDSVILEHEVEHPDGVNVSSFGLALGHMLSRIYPGDRTEQTRLWWGLALGYFGHPARDVPQSYVNSEKFLGEPVADGSDGPPPRVFSTLAEMANVSDEPPQSVLSMVSRKFNEKEESDLSLYPRANYRANLTLRRFGKILNKELADCMTIEDVTDFSLSIQAVIVATTWGNLDEKSLTNAFYRYFKDIEESDETDEYEPSLIEEIFSVATDTMVDSLTNTCVDLELLEEIDDLCRHVGDDLVTINERVSGGVSMHDVFELLWNADGSQNTSEVNSDIQNSLNNVKGVLNKLTYQEKNPDGKEWGYSPPVNERADEFELNQYGKLLGHLCFESEQFLAELYALAFSREIRSAFDIDERLPALVDELVESDVSVHASS